MTVSLFSFVCVILPPQGIRGLRVRKKAPYANTDTLYHYDAQGHLIAEHEAASPSYREYIWLGDQPVAVMQ